MGKSNRKQKKSIYDQIRKPMPKPTVAFKNARRPDRIVDDEEWQDQVDINTLKRLNGG